MSRFGHVDELLGFRNNSLKIQLGILISNFSDEVDGYRVSGASFAIVMLFCTWIVFGGIREKFVPEQEHGDELSVLSELKTLLQRRAFWCVVGIYLCGPTAVVLLQTNIFMFCKYILGNGNLIVLVILCVQGLAIVSAPFWVHFGKFFGKRQMVFCGGPVLCLAMLSIAWVESEALAIVISCVMGLCIAVLYLTPYSMLPDVIEDDELRTGKRREGLFSGFFTISLKLTVTFSLTITNLLLKVSGYEAPVLTCGSGDESSLSEVETQPDAVLQCIRLLCGPIPALLVIVAIFFSWAYPITRESHSKMVAEVKLRRSANSSFGTLVQLQSPSSPSASDLSDISERPRTSSDISQIRQVLSHVAEVSVCRTPPSPSCRTPPSPSDEVCSIDEDEICKI